MEKNFEIEVQTKLEEMKIAPSSSVWNNIELVVKKRKKKRRIIFWISLLTLFVLVSYFFVPTFIFNQNNISNKSKSSQINFIPIQKNSLDRVSKSITAFKNKNITPIGAEIKTSSERVSNVRSNEFYSQNLKTKNSATKNLVRIQVGKDHLPFSKKTETIIQIQRNDNQNLLLQLDTTQRRDTIKESQFEKIKKEVENKIQTPLSIDSVQLKSIKKIVSDWKLGLNFEGGLSSFQRRKSSAIQQNVLPAPNMSKPSPVKAGNYFSLSLSATKELTTYCSISTGFDYAYFTTQMNVGKMINEDTVLQHSNSLITANYYYPNDNSIHFINKFNTVRLPISVNFKPLNTIPFSIQVGITLQKIFSTNALTYNTNSNLYYKDEYAFSKIQGLAHFGFSYQLIDRRNYALKLGTRLHYGLSNLNYKETDTKRMFMLGLGVAVLQKR